MRPPAKVSSRAAIRSKYPKTQEPQGKTIQEVTLDELEERSETLRIKREAEKAETRITRAQMEKWTKDPKIKDQVLIQL